MLEYFLGFLGLGLTSLQRADDRKLRALTILSNIDAAVIESAMMLDFEIVRLRDVAVSAGIDPEVVINSLVVMRAQCEQIRDMANTNRALVNEKGASVEGIGALEQWAGTCSQLAKQVVLSVQHIEDAIARPRW
ncbi:hypothetical protein [Paracoccus sp. S1E-3]|uniref:hypothetical protein n=1 Tax=Paracoccus sp. S1E-3 TaxID=2756130 RepID=UPI0015EE7866|nr:hypothetical protein [Paracoccus sp. S1E-3]MBA4492332.1 hypothetical protein [Paracoccus sp. S1E-3]